MGVLHVNQAQINVDHAGKLASAAKWSRAAERDIQIGGWEVCLRHIV